ncbi:hypothetical protein BH23ACT2_BH23ACT2_07730 [soil metagenome]
MTSEPSSTAAIANYCKQFDGSGTVTSMAQSNVLKRYLDAGMAFTAITQAKAEALVKDLVKTGEIQTEHAQAMVNEVVERSRKNTEAFIQEVREEIATSAESLGLATVADIARIEKVIDTIRPGATRTSRGATKKRPAKKTAAKKAPAKKTAAKKRPAKKTAAKKAPAKKTAAKKRPAKKTAAKKRPAKKAAATKTQS